MDRRTMVVLSLINIISFITVSLVGCISSCRDHTINETVGNERSNDLARFLKTTQVPFEVDIIKGFDNVTYRWSKTDGSFFVRSLSDEEIFIDFVYENDPNIEYIFLEIDGSSFLEPLSLAPNSSVNISINVLLDDDVLAGTTYVNITLSDNTYNITLSMPVIVEVHHHLSHSIWPDRILIAPGKAEDCWLHFRNMGNVPERFRITFGEENLTGDLSYWRIGILTIGLGSKGTVIIPSPNGREYDIRDLSEGQVYSTKYDWTKGNDIVYRDALIILGIDQDVEIHFIIKAPKNDDPFILNASILHIKMPDGLIDLSLRCYYPDLSVDYVDLDDDDLTMGEDITFSIKIVDLQADINWSFTGIIQNISILIFEGDQELSISNWEISGEGWLEVTIKIPFRLFIQLRIVIDPENDIPEINDQFNGADNNVFLSDYLVSNAKVPIIGNFDIFQFCFISILVFILIIIIMILLFFDFIIRKVNKKNRNVQHDGKGNL